MTFHYVAIKRWYGLTIQSPHNPIQPPQPLVVKCVSNSDTLGPWTLAENQGREIRFRVAFDGMTVFTCDFTWGSRHHAVTVFNANHDKCFNEMDYYWQPVSGLIGSLGTLLLESVSLPCQPVPPDRLIGLCPCSCSWSHYLVSWNRPFGLIGKRHYDVRISVDVGLD
ncbi:hypothetical protein DM860_004506 [Cuscuta australis]|uniref:S-protein homolog n=1 Tax=Cuscuta australis TaxID=267555 RepID=A0A328E7L7_9ASTE|nr:hypothetical protein DM860_004506 [Cuscuta australis]